MIGAILGDVVGSIYEFDNIKTKEFELFDKECFFTDDSVMTVAIAEALLQAEEINEENLEDFKENLSYGRTRTAVRTRQNGRNHQQAVDICRIS